MEPFENPYWDLTTAAAWAVIRDPDVLRLAADSSNEDALFESRAAYLARWREVNERLWGESSPPRSNDSPLAIEIPSGLPDEVHAEVLAEVTPIRLSDEGFTERLRQLEAAGKIRLRRDDTFPIVEYLTSLFQAGRWTATARPAHETTAHTVPPPDWAFLEIVGGDHQRLFVRRIGEQGKAFGDVRVERAQVLEVFPPIEGARAAVSAKSTGRGPTKPAANRTPKERPATQRKPTMQATVAEALLRRFPSGRPTHKRDELLRLLREEPGLKTLSLSTLDRAKAAVWPASSEQVTQ